MKDKKLVKKVIVAMLLSVVLNGLLYIAFCFGSWESNPGKWNELTRVMFSMLALFVSIIPTWFTISEHES